MSRVKCVLTVDCPTVSTIYAVETVSKKVGTYRGKIKKRPVAEGQKKIREKEENWKIGSMHSAC